MPAASEPAPGSVIAMERDALAAHGRLQPALDLLAIAFEQHLVDVAEGAADEDVGGAAELLLGQHVVDRAEPAAAKFCRECSSHRGRAPSPFHAPRARVQAVARRYRQPRGTRSDRGGAGVDCFR